MKFNVIGIEDRYSGKAKELWESFGAAFATVPSATGDYWVDYWPQVTVNDLSDLKALQDKFGYELKVDFKYRRIVICNRL